MTIVKLRFSRRLAISQDQGVGWSEFTGNQWIQPCINGGAISLRDSNGSERLVFDCESNNNPGLFEMSTYNQLEFSSPSYLDKAGIATEDGGNAEIEWAKYCGEIVADTRRQNDTLELLESHIFVRPQIAMNDGRTGYNDDGLRDGFVLSVEDFTEGNIRIPIGIATDVPTDGDIVFSGAKVEGRRHQFKVSGNRSEIKITGISHQFASKPRPAARINRETGDTVSQSTLMSGLLFWMTRNGLGRDRVAKKIWPTSQPIVRTTGPYGLNDAIMLSGGETGMTISDLPTNVSKYLVCCASANLTFYTGNQDPATVIGTWDNWSVYVIEYTGSTMFLPAGIWYDARLVVGDPSAIAVEYYNNIRYSGGNGFLPSA